MSRRLLSVSYQPEFRVAILACTIWLLLVQAYQPWRYYTRSRPSSLELATFFFWRLGYNIAHSRLLAVTVGVVSIFLLVYMLGWVIRSFRRAGATPALQRQSTARSVTSTPHAGEQDANGTNGFLELCRSIRLNCWQQIQGDDAHRESNVIVLKAAYRDYERQAAPWLSIILSACHDPEAVSQARNAAAKCLGSLAGGFISVNHLDDAERLCSQALQLVQNDPGQESEMRALKDQIRSEREKVRMAGQVGSQRTVRDRALPRTIHARGPMMLVLGTIVLLFTIFLVKTFSSSEGHSAARLRTPEDKTDQQPPNPSTAKSTPTVVEPPPSQSAPDAAPRAQDVPLPPDVKGAESCPSNMGAQEPQRPANGKEFGSGELGNGHGELTVVNGNSLDAAVIVENSNLDGGDRLVYVRAGMRTTISSIPPGQHPLKFQIGSNWDEEGEHFRCVSATEIFDRMASFEENETATNIEYSTVEVTLHKLASGNVHTTPIDPALFRRHRHP